MVDADVRLTNHLFPATYIERGVTSLFHEPLLFRQAKLLLQGALI